MDISLVMVTSEGDSREVPVTKLPAILGRGDDCKIRVPLPTVSRHHCELRIEDDELVVRDAGSSNGTFVNGDRVKERELIPGDLLAVGPLVFVVRIDGHPKEIDAADSFAAGAVAQAEPASNAGVPEWGAGAPSDEDGGFEPLVEDGGDDSEFDFDLDLSELDEEK